MEGKKYPEFIDAEKIKEELSVIKEQNLTKI